MTLFTATPTVAVLGNRGQTVRNIAYHRHPNTPDVTDERITFHQYDTRGFLAQSRDPRLHETGLSNVNYSHDLNGTVLRTQSADAGTTIALSDSGARPFLNIFNVNSENDRSQAITRTYQYEENSLPGRPLGITEQGKIIERFIWGDNSVGAHGYNLAGQLVSHYDPAGLLSTDSVSLSGVPLSVTRQLLPDDAQADWQGADASAWNDLLAGETYTTLSTVDAAGNVLTTLDAKGNTQRVAYDVAGLLKGSWLTVSGGSEQVIVKSLTYSAAGQKLREEHGNGVVTTYSYEAETQRLVGIKTERTTATKVLQDLRYGYDPVGNVLVITNDAEETRFWRNQQVVPENTYIYDSLYQLVSATGREMASAAQQISNLPDFTSFDNATYTNYSRTYTYDNAGNLTKIQHSAPASGNNYTTSITVSDRSNRAVLSTFTENPADVEARFTAGGQQKQLLPGQSLVWTARQELQKVTPVTRDGAADDNESYRYDASSQRIVKVTSQLTGNNTQTKRVIYLPGLELRNSTTEELQVITVGVAGRAQVRVLHWESGQPAGIANDQIRYSYDNLTGSSALEVDGSGELISQEEYYPYGGTALFAARSQLEADYKILRYSGKEQDATGLYYYGYRYYQPWAGRWLSADPSGAVDGLNLFRMVHNNPISLIDSDGRISLPAEILIVDVLNPLSKDPTNAWFEELKWNPETSRLETTPAVYTRGGKILEGETSQWESATDSPTAFTVFQDPSGVNRLFVSTFQQHIGVKPGMGNPLYAGILMPKRDQQGNLFYRIDNESGHYQPSGDINAAELFSTIVGDEGLSHFTFAKSTKSSAPANTRLVHLTSPEEYGEAASRLRREENKQQSVIDYLNEHGLWEPTKSQRSHMPWVNELMRWEAQQNPAPAVAQAPATVAAPVINRRATAPETPHVLAGASPGRWSRFRGWVSGIFNRVRNVFRSRASSLAH
ncbi:RHS repeat protein [Kosakonia quasisacchari]